MGVEVGIEVPLQVFIPLMTERCGSQLAGALSMLEHASAASAMTLQQASDFLVATGILVNKTELDNIMFHFGNGTTIDLAAFFVALGPPPTFLGTTFGVDPPESPYKKHLSLSGVSHVGFEQQYKPFPAHWGAPPNAQVKGYPGIVKELPGGYGKGNTPMCKWVQMNLDKDYQSGTADPTGTPYPYGNYSFGCTGVHGESSDP